MMDVKLDQLITEVKLKKRQGNGTEMVLVDKPYDCSLLWKSGRSKSWH